MAGSNMVAIVVTEGTAGTETDDELDAIAIGAGDIIAVGPTTIREVVDVETSTATTTDGVRCTGTMEVTLNAAA